MHSVVGQEVLCPQNELVIDVQATSLGFVLETDQQSECAHSVPGVVEEGLVCVQSDDLVSADINAQLSIEFFNNGGAAGLVLECGLRSP